MVIEFISLYLGLLIGIQPVAVAVSADVASVDIVLDRQVVATLNGAPWRADVDFGAALVPRSLDAVARDGAGRELGRVTQRINLPRPAAEAGIVLERRNDRVVAARLTWQSVAEARPVEVTAILDGKSLRVPDPERIAIPRHDPDEFHLLVVELVFSKRDRVQVVASFGGTHTDEARTELTALPISGAARGRMDPESLSVAVRNGDKALPVVSVERGGSDIVFVRDHDADLIIERLGARQARPVGGFGVTSSSGVSEGASGLGGIYASPQEALRRLLTLASEDRGRLIWPATQRVWREDVRMDLFPASPVFTANNGGIFWALTQDVRLDGARDLQRLADAVAVAGLAATENNRRRAVVLVLGPASEDASRFEPRMVREFLRTLRVPLYVWTVGEEEPVPIPSAWTDVEGTAEITTLDSLRRAVQRLSKDLGRQRILWVEGAYLPQELTVAGDP